MFGMMLASLLEKPNRKIAGRKGNAHHSGFSHILKDFHDVNDVETLLQMNNEKRIKFFEPLKYVYDRKCIHTLSSYKFLKVPFAQYFKSFTVVALVPEHEDTHKNWATRYESAEGDMQDKISDKIKYLKKDLVYAQETNYHIKFDPINFFNFQHTQKLVTDICVHAKSDTIKIPYENWSQHVAKSRLFFESK
tara:strand:- start:2866 stop:3441 length:576 start_codon:yes stop_codon:yes gene_type:complete